MAGVVIDGRARAYPLELLRTENQLSDSLAGTALTLSYAAEDDQVRIETAEGRELAPVILYWFVWKSMYPEGSLYRTAP